MKQQRRGKGKGKGETANKQASIDSTPDRRSGQHTQSRGPTFAGLAAANIRKKGPGPKKRGLGKKERKRKNSDDTKRAATEGSTPPVASVQTVEVSSLNAPFSCRGCGQSLRQPSGDVETKFLRCPTCRKQHALRVKPSTPEPPSPSWHDNSVSPPSHAPDQHGRESEGQRMRRQFGDNWW